MVMVFMEAVRIWKDKLKPRMVWSLGQIGPVSSFPEIGMEISESRTPGNPIPGFGEQRISESLTPGNVMPGRNESLTMAPECKEPLEFLMTRMGQAAMRQR